MATISLNNFGKLKVLAFITTVVLVIFYDYLPKRKLDIHPQPGSYIRESTDKQVGGNSEFHWVDKTAHNWVCDFKSGAPYPYCSFSLAWSKAPHNPIDFSLYTHLAIDLKYTGEAEYLRVFIRNTYKSAEEPDELQSGKFNTVSKKADTFKQITNINFDDLRVSDWWIEDFKVPPNEIMTDVSQAIALGIDIPHPTPLGKHEFHLNSITAVGVYFYKESLYFSIIIFWSVLLLSEMAFRFIQLRNKSRKYSRTLSKMSEQTAIYKKRAETDKLTRILNREGLSTIVEKLKTQGLLQQYALIVLDLDHFKRINDEHGHSVGDAVLQDVAQIMNSCMRSYDIVARWGGEEFVILFHCLDEQNLFPFAEKIRHTIESATFKNGATNFVTASIGVSKINNPADFEASFERADKAVYAAKEGGRNRVVID
jgi:diguanylate cyclase (GGDEF)-like protein